MRALLVVIALLAAGCGGGGDTLTVYSGRSEQLIQPILDRFTEETGIEVEVRYGDSAEMALLIEEEGDNSPADVLIAQSPGAVGLLAERDLLTAIDGDLLNKVDARFRGGASNWIGLTGRVRVLVYNAELVDPAELPSSVWDLVGAAYEGEVGVAPTNGSFQDFVTAMRDLFGDEPTAEWLAGLEANDAATYPNNTSIVEAVGRGEIRFGLVNHYYNFRVLVENPDAPSRNHFFSDGDIGGLMIITSAAIPKSSDEVDAAERLIAFLLDTEAQRYFAEETFEYPLAAGQEPVVDVPALGELEIPVYDFQRLGGGLERTTELIADSGLD